MKDKRRVEELSVEELEHILLIKRRQERIERLRRLSASRADKTPLLAALEEEDLEAPRPSSGDGAEEPAPGRRATLRRVRDSVLLALEVLALIGLVYVLVSSLLNMRTLNEEVALARETLPTPTATPQIQLQFLPGAHVPPSAASTVPQRLADLVQPVVPVPIPTPGPQSPTRIVIPSIGVDAPIVPGDDWEQLKKGVGHHLGSANPGERGNMVLSAHNDIFGEIFRDLDKVELEDEIIIYAGEVPFRYVVKAIRIVEPTDVSVMGPTSNAVATLITCYPYMIDTQRIVVIAELAQ